MALDKDTLESLKIDRGTETNRYAVSAAKRWRKPAIIGVVVLVLALAVRRIRRGHSE